MSSVREIADLKSPEPIRKKLIELNDLHAQINKIEKESQFKMGKKGKMGSCIFCFLIMKTAEAFKSQLHALIS